MMKKAFARILRSAAIPATLAAVSLFAISASAQPNPCDPHSYGAKADGKNKDTVAIQLAIDACAKQGGGTVLLSGGTFLSAPIVLRSNINLHIDKGATLLGSPDHADYPAKTEFRNPGLQSLISATNAENVSITGDGTIDGNGETWWEMARKTKGSSILGSDHPRPRGIVFDHSKHILMEGVTVQNSPFWQIVPYYSDGITIRNIRVLAPQHAPNTDGIDPFSSSNVLIEHVYEDVGDDDIAIKSGAINSPGPDAPSKNIIIRDCTFDHGHGVSVGSEMAGGAQNILVERIHMKGTDNGVRVKANRDRGNDMGNMVFRDIDMVDVKDAIIISEYYPHLLPEAGEKAQPVQRLTPHFHDITVENVKATGSKLAGVIVGLPESPALNIVLKNVSISAEKGLTIGDATVTLDHVNIQVQQGEAITVAPSAKVTTIK